MKEPQVVKLRTLHFYDAGSVPPRVIALKDCSLLNDPPIPGIFSALYGYNGSSGIPPLKKYADDNRLALIHISVEIKLDCKQNPRMPFDDLPHHDFASLLESASVSLRNEFGEMLRRILDSGKYGMADVHDAAFNDLINKPRTASSFSREFARDVLMARPDLVSAIMDSPVCRHLKVIAFRTRSPLIGAPLQVAAVPFRHWSSIRKVTCLTPGVDVLLENPVVDYCSKNIFTPPPPTHTQHKAIWQIYMGNLLAGNDRWLRAA